MLAKYIKNIKSSSGFTLIELIIAVSLIMIILVAVYNLFFLSINAYHSLETQNVITMQMEGTITNLDREIKQARKAMEDDVLVAISDKELIIYTDIIGDKRPEKVRYRANDSKLYKSFAQPNNNIYPYTYNRYGTERVVLENIINDDIFTEIDKVNDNTNMYSENNDYRRKVKVHFVLENLDKSGSNMEILSYLMTKSKVEAD